jgi:hypothetical protein
LVANIVAARRAGLPASLVADFADRVKRVIARRAGDPHMLAGRAAERGERFRIGTAVLAIAFQIGLRR